jgi:MerR family transcriptional regulator, light-induced transcriptional regulator
MKDLITAHEAAKELGLSPSTFKRFCDTHEIPLIRTPGGHRRIDRSHLVMASHLLHSKGQGTPRSAIDPKTILDRLREADAAQLLELLWGATRPPAKLVDVLEDQFVPALWILGDLWYRGEMDLAEAQVCIQTAGQVLDSILARVSIRSTNVRIVGGALAPSMDTLASKLVAISFQTIGVRAIDLGGNLTPELLSIAANRYKVEAIWLNYTHVFDQQQLISDHQALVAMLPPGCRVIVGGGGLSPSLRRLLPNAYFYESLVHMLSGEADLLQHTLP